ncbi:MAG: ABC transporter ATP-binding protein [Candidatus Thermoplasmatota archaeon]
MIEINSLSIIDRNEDRLLDDLNLKIEEGKTTLICGEPGSGKTLLLKAIKGLVSEGLEKKGDIKTEGEVGLIFQEPRKQMVRRNVKMEAAFDLENRRFSREQIEKKIEEYSRFLKAEHLLNKDIDEISHGELTKTAILSTLVTEPDIILFDEPLSSLDHPNRKMLLEILERLREKGTTIVIAEHDIRDLIDLSDRMILLKDGDILEDGDPKENKTMLYREGIKIPFGWELELEAKEERS